MYLLYLVMADFQLYCFEPECVPNPEDSDPNNYFGFGFGIHKLGKFIEYKTKIIIRIA